jgi:cytochrome P450
MLRFVEEIILLAHDENTGEIGNGLSPRTFHIVLSGAVLMDLALENRIDTDPDSLMLIDSTPTGDALLDPTLAKVAASPERRDTAFWVGETAKDGDEIMESALARLHNYGILEPDTSANGIFALSNRVSRSRRYPTVDGEAVEEVRLRVMRALFTNDIPSPHDIALICLANACGLLSTVLSKEELYEVQDRLDLIRKMDLIARVVGGAVEALETDVTPSPPLAPRPWTELPCPRRLPMIGNLVGLMRDRRAYFLSQYRALGPIFRVRALGADLIVMAGPEANRFVSKGNRYFRTHEMWTSFNAYLGASRSLASIDGPEHLQMRRDHSGIYSRKVVEGRIPEVVGIIEREISQWRPGVSIPVFRAFQRIFAGQIGYLATGVFAPDYIDDIVDFSNIAVATHLSRHVPKLALKLPRFRRAHKRVDELIGNILDLRGPGRRVDRPPDLVDKLFELNEAQPHYISEADAKLSVLAPFIAGLDTAAAASAFMLFEALKEPDLLGTMTDEADFLFRDGAPATRDLLNLDVIRRAMKETMRLYPLSVVIFRKVANSFEFNRYSIPAGANVLISYSLPHSMEEHWSNPSQFDVDRFVKERAEHAQEKGIYEPFGLGAHACLGRSLAETLIVINIAAILHHVEPVLDPPGYRMKVRQLPGLHPRSSFRFRVAKKRTALLPDDGRSLFDA